MFSNKVKRTLTLLAKRKQCCASNVSCTIIVATSMKKKVDAIVL